jgi:nitrite reductase (NO-forming)
VSESVSGSRAAVGDGITVTGAARGKGVLQGEARPTPSFLLLYLAVGLLLAEAAMGGAIVLAGGSLLKTAGTSSPTSPQVPSGANVSFELTAYITGYVGGGGAINGLVDPTLTVGWGDYVTINLVQGDSAMSHDIYFDGYNVQTRMVTFVGDTASLSFQAVTKGTFPYYCTVPGHRQSGMVGSLVVGNASTNAIGPEAPLTVSTIIHSPTDLPPPITRNYSATVDIYLHAEEQTAEIEPGTSFTYWTYNGTVPGPFFRVRVNDTVVVHFSNDQNSTMNHSVDFHAATGPGGGGAVTQTPPGQSKTFQFKALIPGLYVYHCASPNIPTHLAMGMYGLLLVQPAGGLPTVDHEYYLMQGELYTLWGVHSKGNQLFNASGLVNENPTYVVFNGAYDALTGTRAIKVAVNDTVRIFFGVGGPNLISSFHMIGSMFDTVWANGDFLDPPLHGLQTVMVAPGSAMTTDFMAMYPGNYPLVDHSIVNAMDKGALAILNVTGWANSSIFHVDASVLVAATQSGSSGTAATVALTSRPV